MRIKSACFAGHRASKMPYNEMSKEHEILENILKEEIIKLIRDGVSEFYAGGQKGIDTLAALLVLNIEEEFGTTANLNLVLPYENMQSGFSLLQMDNIERIKQKANAIIILNDEYTTSCYRERNKYMIDKSDYLIAVCMEKSSRSGTKMTINMAKKIGLEIIKINPVTYEVARGWE